MFVITITGVDCQGAGQEGYQAVGHRVPPPPEGRRGDPGVVLGAEYVYGDLTILSPNIISTHRIIKQEH